MIDVNKALEVVIKKSKTLGTKRLIVAESEGYVLADDLKSKFDLPLFNNSAMDGYAIKHSDSLNADKKSSISLPIIKTIKAGDSDRLNLKSGWAAKIMTGALVPGGADTVVRKEDCTQDGDYLILTQKFPARQNIRYKGEEIKKGAIGLKKGTLINPAAIGFILELGHKKISVYRKPNISLLVTGEELLNPGEKIKPGKIRDTNSYSLSSAITKENANLVSALKVKGNYDEIKSNISSLLKYSDMLIITGGISVGDYDYIKDILNSLGVKKLFWGVSQRPGGPLFFGIYRNKLIFGLPGNPASSLVCYYEYIRPSILLLTGRKDFSLIRIEAFLTVELKKKPGKTHFLRGIVQSKNNGYQVSSAGEQGSHILRSFAQSNCFIFFPRKKSVLKKGEKVEVHLLPF